MTTSTCALALRAVDVASRRIVDRKRRLHQPVDPEAIRTAKMAMLDDVTLGPGYADVTARQRADERAIG